jgi:TM2 domain-containing membrane protein YozV
MSNADTPSKIIAAGGRQYDVLAAVLSYLIPGLGQVYQGRVAKGVLFMVCLLGLFLYGMYLGSWSNVYLPPKEPKEGELSWLPVGKRTGSNLILRLPFAGQFWIGMAAWPALWQYQHPEPPPADQVNNFWHNFERTPPETAAEALPGYQGKTLKDLQADGDKTWDLGWVYTVIAGVLNILVIYDAFAGPAFHPEPEKTAARKEEAVPV